MNGLKIFFWLSFSIVFYSYLGYGIILYGIVFIKKLLRTQPPAFVKPYEPEVALIVPAFNEEDYMEAKIQNILELDYPVSKLSVIFITDGSTDSTSEIVSRFKNFTLLHEPERKGKSAALNRAIQVVKEPIVVFCDANTLLNKQCLGNMMRHYLNPKVGGVAGEKKIMMSGDMNVNSAGEGLYWKYESLLKRLDSEFYTVVGAAGELFSMRTHLYEILPEETIIEDFVLSLRVCIKGYVVRYEPEAYAVENASQSIQDEQKRKVRISAGAFQAMAMLRTLFNIFKNPAVSFQFISHRVLRWTLCPVCLPVIFIVNLMLVLSGTGGLYVILFFLQGIFYLLAFSGWILTSRNVKVKIHFVPYYFVFMNISVILGFKRFIQKSQSVLWEKAARQKSA